MKHFLPLTSLAAAIALATSTHAAAGTERVINVSLPLGPDSQQGIGVLKFGEELERLSEGRLTIEPHYDNALGAEREVVEGMGFGIIDAGIASTGPMGGFVDEFMLFDLPYVFENHKHAYAFLDSEHGEELARLAEEGMNVKFLAWMENGFRHNTNSVRPIEKPSNLEGINHRTQESRVQVDTWEALGANATPMAWTEVYTALQQGVMDSQENPLATIYDVNFYEVQDYLNITQHVYSPAPLMMGLDLFNSFSEEDQAIIIEAAQIALPVQREASQELEQRYLGQLEELGMTVTHPDLAPFREAVKPVLEEWAPTVGAELVDAAVNYKY
ncbi:DctP family TRAP transporter solute-binding subunit [Vreelandella aquamarina]|jgi:tripartite ATP-independent transporter DctP family solute receptor|uniref:Periplasmic substrate-binding transporter n=1 Tax=Vreelandella aquamarina TaxID=77097 RepID=A0A1N6ICM6_9GAMM|nr:MULTISPECIES: DctP family TRAP transporter solute-binding subunit [Halomonas]MCC4289221.1 DctP family TRAP transporter solute-binding subunit [Halomonas meridiana]SIN60798.1 tripartite ATP-independent transporter solute receptor, DctP family [Halomonas meridiana]SIN68228.1 tripartite ATP-independent transporter solute receptor, DctP family [Halomonas meridiana]SIO29776.1 tripartite ATP-independent transporter solute receptor, DctP family [Halomonas meridiana]BCB72487.1 periplasmic substrate|tara:strand:- start:4603 stop:5589 length:987 start_codon:yes stop_codon:yes gene_type:complete